MLIKALFTIFWLLVFAKALFFWLWLWQLKEYHLGRLKAHFETQALKKIVASFWRVRFPRFTKKMLLLLIAGFLLEVLILGLVFYFPGKVFYFFLLISLVLSPLIFSLLVLFFQIPTVVLRNQLLKKAQLKREGFKNLIVIGITGSYGKTSTKEFLNVILSSKFHLLKTENHINSEIGIAQTILNKLKPEHRIFIVEMGAYEQGKIKEVCQMVQPKIGILTGISEQHLSTFGSLENIIKAKFELIGSLPEDGMAIFNGDNDKIMSNVKIQTSPKNLSDSTGQANQIQNPNVKKIFCSTKEKIDVWAENIKVEKEYVSFMAFSKDGDSAYFKVDILGKHYIPNILMAGAAAKELGMTMVEIAKTCEKIHSNNLKPGINGLNILDYTYSANPASVLAHLDYLEAAWQGAKKIIVMPCLIELGLASKEVHQRIGERIGKVCDLALITTRDRFKELRQGARKSGMSEEKILFVENPLKYLETIKAEFRPGDVALLESRVPKVFINAIMKN